ncbi:MAG TPA: putative Ig domain-containing protein, partial [Mycobacterium sp.]|nr:putative Ig domain-containing protein [Mycobacterium sp.]
VVNPPTDDGGAAITTYTVTASPGGATGTLAGPAGGTITLTGLTNGTAYTFTATATNSAGTSPASAPSASVTPMGAQTITFSNPGTQNFGTAPTLTATASSGLAVTFSSSTTAVCTITPTGVLTAVSPGTCSIDANQAGDGTYLAAPMVTQSFAIVVSGGAVSIGTGALPQGTAGTAYSQTITAAGGATPYAFAVSAGTLPAGLTLDSAGLLSGTPTVAGNFSFTVKVTDAATQTATQTFTLDVQAPTIALSPSTLPAGTLGSSYAQTLGASGGQGTYTYAVSAGSLPAGLSLSSAGVLGGTPTTAGSSSFTITATDGLGFTGSQAYTLDIDALAADAPAITGVTAGDGQVQVVVSPPTDDGGAVITSYTATASPGGATGTLAGPAGGTITVTGLTNGTAYTFTATATNSAGTSPASVPSASVTPMGVQTITFGNPGATNFGTAPQLVATAGSGLAVTFASTTTAVCTVTSTGILTTVSPGTCSIDANQAGDGTYLAAPTVTQSFAIVVSGGAVSIGTGALPQGTAGTAYSQTIIAAGGATPYAFDVSAGTLPAGLTLDGAGLLSGTPTVAGHFSFTVKVTDAATQTATRAFTLDVQAPTIALSPSTLPAGTLGTSYAQTLGASGVQGAYTYAVSAGSLPAGLSLSSAGALGGTPTAAGSSSFTITATDGLGFTGSQAYTLTIEQPAPIANDDTASTAANGMATIAVTSNDRGGPITSIAIAQQPTHGTATISGLDVLYTPAANYFGNDTLKYTATGPGGTSAAATVSITVVAGVIPVATAKNATVLAGKPVTIHAAAGASNGPFTTATVVNAPTSGTATVQGTDIIYTADPDASGTLGFDYTLSNAFGTSQAAHVTLTVNPRPVAPALTATAAAGTTVQVDLTTGAHGGPFTAAKVVSISPAHAGSATIASTGGGYTLAFTSAASFDGVVQITYTLSNAYATSMPGTVDVTVKLRSDPSKNAEVLGVLEAQAEAA